MGFGSFAAFTQWYLYGRRHFTATGWRRASAKHTVAVETMDLTGKCFCVTGANSGIGFCLSEYLAGRGARLYMVCRNAERAERARRDVIAKSGNQNVFTLIADVGLSSDVRTLFQELSVRERALDGLVCNAGALVSERKLTSEGFESTFATHLLCGCYLATQLALPLLRASSDPRVVYVSSGGAMLTPFPSWEVAARAEAPPGQSKPFQFDGNNAYTYAKRGQILLAERLARDMPFPKVPIVSCHPGWVDTPGVDAAFGSRKSMLDPMRTLWQGTEGIAWLASAPGTELRSGEFYLDRAVAPQHMAGPFFSEGSHTKNSEAEVDELMRRLAESVGA
jgi:dehydrogenase/reductase SDR family protein 12